VPAPRRPAGHAVCQVCGQSRKDVPLIPASVIRPPLATRIAREVPDWSPDGFICLEDLNRFRAQYVETLLAEGMGEITALEQSVVERISRHEMLATNVDAELDKALTLGERLADRVASFGGSWRFILVFAAVMVAWMALNSWLLMSRAFDPYPYILLNLVLSCLAAVQAPVIMMSQNRQSAKDRSDARADYEVNVRAEVEVMALHAKLDLLREQDWARIIALVERQQFAIEQLEQRLTAGGSPEGHR
jgi:uncharacterized membrane protein